MKEKRAPLAPWIVLVAAIFAVPITLVLVPGTPSYPSRAVCWLGNPTLIKMHDWGNAFMWVEYVMIPALLIWTGWRARAWRLAQSFPVLVLEGCNFIFWCGATHLMARTEVYKATPWLTGTVIAVAVLSGILFIGDFLRKRHLIDRWLRAMNTAAEAVDYIERHPDDGPPAGLSVS